MNNIEESFFANMDQLGPWEDNPVIAIAVSGGVDSMVLTHLAEKWTRNRNAKIIAITIDHGLRTESNYEANSVNKILSDKSIEHHIIKWNYSDKPISNIQEKARNARYMLLSDFCKKYNILHLLVAHHMNDQAETFYMRIERGSGIDGLSCMSNVSYRPGIRIIRPLLNNLKSEIIDYAKKNHLKWFEDSSNINDKFDRIRVRDNISNDDLKVRRFALTANNIARAKKSLDKIILNQMIDIVNIYKEGYAKIDVKKLLAIGEEESFRILSSVIITIGKGSKIRLSNLKRLYDQISNSISKITTTLGGCVISKINNELLIIREVKKASFNMIIIEDYIYFDNRFMFKLNDLPEYFEIKYPTNEEINKIRKDKEIKLPNNIVSTIAAIYVNSEIISIPLLGYYAHNQIEISCYFKPLNNLTNSLN